MSHRSPPPIICRSNRTPEIQSGYFALWYLTWILCSFGGVLGQGHEGERPALEFISFPHSSRVVQREKSILSARAGTSTGAGGAPRPTTQFGEHGEMLCLMVSFASPWSSCCFTWALGLSMIPPRVSPAKDVRVGGINVIASDGTSLLRNADICLKAGTVNALCGRSGSGKMTLLRALHQLRQRGVSAVSYTPLTLPTIYPV